MSADHKMELSLVSGRNKAYRRRWLQYQRAHMLLRSMLPIKQDYSGVAATKEAEKLLQKARRQKGGMAVFCPIGFVFGLPNAQ